MANQFFQESRMESQCVKTKVVSVMYQNGGNNASVLDGTLAVLGDFYIDPVYTGAYGANTIDINTRIATLPSSATQAGVGVVSISSVPIANGLDNTTYKIGTEAIGLSVEAGKAVRFRKLALDDTFFTGSDNTNGTLTVGQYAIVNVNGNWDASATKPSTGLVAKVISTSKVSRGVTADVTQYFMKIEQLQ